jgi:hypothetical protein
MLWSKVKSFLKILADMHHYCDAQWAAVGSRRVAIAGRSESSAIRGVTLMDQRVKSCCLRLNMMMFRLQTTDLS